MTARTRHHATRARPVVRREDQAERHEPRDERDMLRDLGINAFEHEYEKLLRATGAEKDFASAEAAQALVRAQLAMAIRLLAKLDRASQKAPQKTAYACVAIGDHVRALTQDMRGFSDHGATLERLRRDCVAPELAALATTLIDRLTKMRSEMITHMDARAATHASRSMRKLQDNLADVFGEAESSMSERIERALTQIVPR